MLWVLFNLLCTNSILIKDDSPVATGITSFANHQVLRVEVQNDEDMLFLIDQHRVNYTNFDFWTIPGEQPISRPMDILMSDETAIWFTQVLVQRGMNYSVMIDNVQELIEQQMIRSVDTFALDQYNTLADINTFITTTLATNFPDWTSVISVGNSYQNRPLNVLKINVGSTTKTKGLWMNAGIHAREWITPATLLWITNQLLTDYGTNTDVTTILDTFEIYVMPVFNVDGYSYTWTNNRMWRKNRKPSSKRCVGTDLNRNFAKGWGGQGSSTDPCSDLYRGSAAFSEPESKNVSSFLAGKPAGFWKGYMDWHSYGQLWLSPWGYTSVLPPDSAAQATLGNDCATAISGVHGTTFTVGPVYTTIYPASGITVDWTYDSLGIKYSYGPELRDTGTYGFLLPANQIQPSGEEIYAALKVWATAALTV